MMEAGTELHALPGRRRWVNSITRHVVAVGGGAVIAAIALIFIYLLWVVAPIFAGATVGDGQVYDLGPSDPLFLDVNESDEIGLAFDAGGTALFWDLDGGGVKRRESLGRELVRVKPVYPMTATYAVLDGAGELNVLQARYPISFDGDERTIGASLGYLFTDQWIEIGETADFDVHYAGNTLSITWLDGRSLRLARYQDAEPDFDLEFPRSRSVDLEKIYDRVSFGPRGQWLYLSDAAGAVEIMQVTRSGRLTPLHHRQLVPENVQLTALEPLLGRYSLLAGDDQGRVTQWFVVRGEFGVSLEPVRRFKLDAGIHHIIAEPRRKGFAVVDTEGQLHLLYTTSERILTSHPLRAEASGVSAISPRSDLLLLAEQNGRTFGYELENEHPEISFSALWSRVWYEGYQEPVYSWQSSSADNDFEPKFSLTPLLFGTLKAAFYAMLFAVPIAIMGALYTAYFMAPVMRRIVKPGIEIMAALPTVILGFLAGLWLAPIIEANLSAVITVLLVLPLAVVGLSLIWQWLPERYSRKIDGWYGLLVVPVIVLAVLGAFGLGPVLEDTFFGGDSRTWFLTYLGLDYDQRNALVVGLAMGLAVIPTIFSIAEDAIYGVPTHLINGSLALGATRWQTLIRVVILTASPGIFSAVMIGLGRAVGETMIVLMATGNTPVMDMNIFQGMRTFAANIAVELPESEVDSSHYRILFLTALVLFMITFAFNTVAELVRQRLRGRYGSL
ncbi:MAG: ABC transporter permease subunit [Gammaproteobacteria bacterium]|nr:MAG: ABC transporter permease subunit [Gammaproteobacteria bacterium]